MSGNSTIDQLIQSYRDFSNLPDRRIGILQELIHLYYDDYVRLRNDTMLHQLRSDYVVSTLSASTRTIDNYELLGYIDQFLFLVKLPTRPTLEQLRDRIAGSVTSMDFSNPRDYSGSLLEWTARKRTMVEVVMDSLGPILTAAISYLFSGYLVHTLLPKILQVVHLSGVVKRLQDKASEWYPQWMEEVKKTHPKAKIPALTVLIDPLKNIVSFCIDTFTSTLASHPANKPESSGPGIFSVLLGAGMLYGAFEIGRHFPHKPRK